MSDIIVGILAGFGGSVIVLGGLIAWLGKVWATRIAEKERAQHSREIVLLRSDLQLQNTQQQHIYNGKWELYKDVWTHLQDIATIGDQLWERASIDRVRRLFDALLNVRMAVNRGRLILQERHYTRINELLEVFENYRLGKKHIIQIRDHNELCEKYYEAGEEEISRQIKQNGDLRAEYQSLLDEIAIQFKKELGIDTQEAF